MNMPKDLSEITFDPSYRDSKDLSGGLFEEAFRRENRLSLVILILLFFVLLPILAYLGFPTPNFLFLVLGQQLCTI